MFSHATLEPRQLKMLTDLLNAHCAEQGIDDQDGKAEVARSLLYYFQSGMTDAASLAAALRGEHVSRDASRRTA